MRNAHQAVQALLDSAGKHLEIARINASEGVDLVRVCFHAAEAARETLTGYLCQHGVTADSESSTEDLLEKCLAGDGAFRELQRFGQCLAPYTKAILEDAEFRPSLGTARAAINSAETINRFVLEKLNSEGTQP